MSVYRPDYENQTGSRQGIGDSVDGTQLAFEFQAPSRPDSSFGYQKNSDSTPIAEEKKTVNWVGGQRLPRASSETYRMIRSLTTKSIDHVAMMIESAKDESVFDIAINGNELIDCLASLWKLREFRCRQWQIGLNFVQSALHNITFEKLSVDACQKLLEIVKILQSSELERDDTQMIKRLLKSIELDPWRAISSQD